MADDLGDAARLRGVIVSTRAGKRDVCEFDLLDVLQSVGPPASNRGRHVRDGWLVGLEQELAVGAESQKVWLDHAFMLCAADEKAAAVPDGGTDEIVHEVPRENECADG